MKVCANYRNMRWTMDISKDQAIRRYKYLSLLIVEGKATDEQIDECDNLITELNLWDENPNDDYNPNL